MIALDNTQTSTLAYDFNDTTRFYAIHSRDYRGTFFSHIFQLYRCYCLILVNGTMSRAIVDRLNPFITVEHLIIRSEKGWPLTAVIDDALLQQTMTCMVPLFGVNYFFQATIVKVYQERRELQITAPEVVYLSKQRSAERYYFPEEKKYQREPDAAVLMNQAYVERKQPHRCLIYSMSDHGIAFVTYELFSLRPGERCEGLILEIPNINGRIPLQGKIVYIKSIDGYSYLYGLQFESMPEEDREFIHRFVFERLYPQVVSRKEYLQPFYESGKEIAHLISSHLISSHLISSHLISNVLYVRLR